MSSYRFLAIFIGLSWSRILLLGSGGGPSAVLAPDPALLDAKAPALSPVAVPVFDSPRPQGDIPDSPDDKDFQTARVFAEPLLANGSAKDVDSDRQLAKALNSFRAQPHNTVSLENFLRSYPSNRWAPSLRLGLGIYYHSQARWTKALQSWEEAYTAFRLTGARNEALDAQYDRTLGELLQLHVRLGHVERVEQLLVENKSRDIRGAGTERVRGAQEGVWLMHNQPGEAFRCGPQAVGEIYQVLRAGESVPEAVKALKSTEKGTSLARIKELADEIGIETQIAFRNPGAEVLYPSVVHWKLGHFAALTLSTPDGFLSKDPTFGKSTWVSKEVLDDEASGYFLVPKGILPSGWREVLSVEAAEIFGKGNSGPAPPAPPPDHQQQKGGPHDGGCGMTVYSFGIADISLNLKDLPLYYNVAFGPAVVLQLDYNHREQASMTQVSSFGAKWSSKWVSYLTGNATVTIYGPGGGQLNFSGYVAATGQYAPQQLTGEVLSKLSATSFELTHSDGSKEVYNLSDGGATPRIFRTKTIDAFGNALTFNYDSNYRLRTLVDAAAKTTVIDYALSTDPVSPDFFKITRVTDPFGRYASFTYNVAGQLQSITDAMGMTSSFNYGTGDFVNALTTPYGTTTFASNDTSYSRSITATDPVGAKERADWTSDNAANTPSTDAASTVPPGFNNSYLNFRNSYFWGKRAMLEAPGIYSKASLTHWLHDAASNNTLTSYTIESTKEPLENRVWRAYAGQTSTYTQGTTSNPSKIARKLDDGTDQIFQYAYNSLGNVIQVIDPLGRETDYEYDANNIDLLKVKQKNGASFDLLSTSVYNTAHRPTSVTDASGQTTTFTYTPRGQIKTVTNPKSETTTYVYEESAANADYGRLKSITGAIAGSTTSFTYDAAGRVRTTTDSQGYQVTFDYDNLDRLIKTTYPDTTYEQVVYNRLNVEWSRSRLGLWTHQIYDQNQNLVESTDSLFRRTIFERCVCGSLSAIIDPLGHRTEWIKDIEDRPTLKIFADGTTEKWIYETTTSRIKQKIDGLNQSKNYTYFNDNAISSIIYKDAAGAASSTTPNVTFTYDPIYPRAASRIDGIGTTTYGYNPITLTPALGAGALASIDGPLANDTTSYTYDELGRVKTRSINAAANQVVYTYDALGRTGQISNLLGNFVYSYVSVTGRVDHVDYPNASKVQYAYYPNVGANAGDGNQRLQQIKNLAPGGTTVLSQFDYSYDAGGRITHWTQTIGGGTGDDWFPRYDEASQVTGVVMQDAVSHAQKKQYRYGYDLAGNRTQEQIDLSVTTSTHDAANKLTAQSAGGLMEFTGTINEPGAVKIGTGAVSVSDTGGTWRTQAPVVSGANTLPVVATDASGNQTSKSLQVTVTGGAARTLAYDANGSMTNDGAGKTFAYDVENRLIKITQASGVTDFVYDGNGRRVQEKLNGTVIKQWIWGDGPQPSEERDAANVVTKRFFPQGEQIGGTSYFVMSDHLGSVREMIDATGAVRARYAYDPYGRSTKTSGDLEADFGFTGFYRHQASGLGITIYRGYDPNIGRWPSRDPIGEEGGMNLYGYVLNDPVNALDLLGLDVWIEGPSGREPTGHQSINVGDPNGIYSGYSFGIDGLSLIGKVYHDDYETGGPIEKFKTQTPSQDEAFKRFLESQINDRAVYGPNTCRTFSQDNYDRAPGNETAAPVRNPANRTTFRKLTTSSKPTSTTTSSSGTGSSK